MTEAHLKGDLISRDKLRIAIMNCHSFEEVISIIDTQPTEIPDDYYKGFQAGLLKQLDERRRSI